MKRYLVAKDNLGIITTSFIDGATGNRALDSALPDHMIGKVKRVRAWEEPDFILQQVVKRSGETLISGPRCGYKYHHPTITREI
jgi:hypothetical protein